MKKYLPILLLLPLLFSCSYFDQTSYSTEGETPYFTVTYQTNKKDIKEIASIFKRELNVEIDYSKSEFYEDGVIEKLELTVVKPDSTKSSLTVTREILAMQDMRIEIGEGGTFVGPNRVINFCQS